MPETENILMKKLSPPEPRLTIKLFAETPRQVPLTRIEKILSNKYGFKTSIISPYSLEARITMPLKLYVKLLEKLWSALKDLSGKTLTICMEHYIVLRNSECLCNIFENEALKQQSLGTKMFCILPINEKNAAYVYCRIDRRYQTIRFAKKEKIIVNDLLQLPKTLFILCREEISASDIDYIKHNIEVFINKFSIGS